MTTTVPPRPVEQLVLPGQTAAPAGPIDASAMYLMHYAFRRDLRLFAAATAATPVGDRDCWARLERRWALFSGTLHKHHSGEDSGLWPLLLTRTAGDPEATAVLTAMSAEHDLIDPLLHRCATGFAALARSAGPAARDALREHAQELREVLETHLRHEETGAMPLVQAHLTTEDWLRLDREHFAPQYGPRDIPAVLGWLMYDLPPEAARRMPGGAVLRRAGALLGRFFARGERRTFRHVRDAA